MRSWLVRRGIVQRSGKTGRAASLRLERLEDRWVPAFTATLTGTTAVFTGDAAGDLLVIDTNGSGLLRHNRFTAGDAGFNSDIDFDSTLTGDQTLAAAGSSTVTVNAGDGNDTLTVGTGTTPASGVDGRFVLNGEGGTDSVIWDDSADTTARTITVQGGTFNQVFIPSTGASVGFGTTNESVSVLAGTGNDTVNVTDPGLTNVSVNTGPGDDSVSFAAGATLGGTLDGGTGTNTLDYNTATAGVNVNLGTDVLLHATLAGTQETPPNSSAATGTADLLFNPTTGTFDLRVTVQGINLADVTASHLHSGAPGVAGPIVFDLGGADSWAAVGNAITRVLAGAPGAVFPAGSISDLLAGNVYVNVHSTAFPNGEIRGQLQVVAAAGSATGTSGLSNFDNVTGGAGDDNLVGNNNVNVIAGGAGNDLIFGLGGNDTISGGAGNDTLIGGTGNDALTGDDGNDRLVWNNGDNTDVMDGGAGNDTVEVNGSDGATGDIFTVSANGARINFQRTNLVPFGLDIGTTETLSVSGGLGNDTATVNDLSGVAGLSSILMIGLAGDDVLDASALPATAGVTVTATGGAGNDVINGSAGADTLDGGPGNDTITGNKGNDSVQGGDGDDLLIWNNGDGSDLMEGGAGTDTVQVNGSTTAGDNFVVGPAATPGRVAFARTNLGLFSLDIGTTEALTVNGGAGADTFTVTPLAGTAVTINGDDPAFPSVNGDRLTLTGVTNPTLVGGGTSGSGQFTAAGTQPVSFTSIESLSPGAAISGTVFNDLNNNGTRDSGEPGLAGVNVTLDANLDGTPDLTATTAADGSFQFPDLPPATYRVRLSLPTGGTQTTANPADVVVTDLNGASGVTFGVHGAIGTVTGVFAVGPGPGHQPQVIVYNADGSVKLSIDAYALDFLGGVRVALGDVNGDGVADVITAPGPGGGPNVKVFNGTDGTLLFSFFAYDQSFALGVFVAAGDVNGDGKADIITGPGAGGGPNVKVFSGVDLTPLASFYAYESTFAGGVSVAAGDFNGDGHADIVTGAGAGGGPHVKVFSGLDLTVLQSFFAYEATFGGGVFVATGDVNGDGKVDIITGAGAGGGPHVQVFSGIDGKVLQSFFAYAATFGGGVRVASVDANGDGKLDIVTGPGSGGGPNLIVFNGATEGAILQSFFAFDSTFGGGIFVG